MKFGSALADENKENESGGNRIMETKGLAQKTAKAAKAQETCIRIM
jgi:hypothetical protein